MRPCTLVPVCVGIFLPVYVSACARVYLLLHLYGTCWREQAPITNSSLELVATKTTYGAQSLRLPGFPEILPPVSPHNALLLGRVCLWPLLPPARPWSSRRTARTQAPASSLLTPHVPRPVQTPPLPSWSSAGCPGPAGDRPPFTVQPSSPYGLVGPGPTRGGVTERSLLQLPRPVPFLLLVLPTKTGPSQHCP